MYLVGTVVVDGRMELVREYTIKRVQVNQDGLTLNGTHLILAYADDVNILGGSVHP